MEVLQFKKKTSQSTQSIAIIQLDLLNLDNVFLQKRMKEEVNNLTILEMRMLQVEISISHLLIKITLRHIWNTGSKEDV